MHSLMYWLMYNVTKIKYKEGGGGGGSGFKNPEKNAYVLYEWLLTDSG